MPAIGADEVFRIGGFVFSKTSVSVKAQGVPYTGIVGIAGEESREGEFLHGQRPDGTPLGITSGLFMPGPLTFKAPIDSAIMLMQQLAAQGLGSYGSVLWTLTLEIFENPSLPTIVMSWGKVKIEKVKPAVPEDASAMMMEFECKHQGMTTSGVGVGLVALNAALKNQAGITVPSL